MTELTPWHQFGLIGLAMGGFCTLLFIIIKWVLSTTREILNQSGKEREAWTKAIYDHTEQAKLFHESVKDAHNYQRLEHQEMIKILVKMNGS